MSDMQIRARPSYLNATPVLIGSVPEGLTIEEIVVEVHRRSAVAEVLQKHAIVQLNGDIIPHRFWKSVKPKQAANIVITVGIHGGGGAKDILGIVMTLAVIVAAPYLGSAMAGGTMLATGMTAGFTTLSSVFTLVAGAAGLLAVNALFPVSSSTAKSTTYSDSATYSISGASNSVNKFSPVPVILGRHKVTPPLGVASYTEISGNDEYLRMLFIWGYGPLKIEDIKIGDTSIDEYDDVEIETREGWDDDEDITLIPSQVLQDPIGVTLKNSTGWITRTSKADANELSVDVSFPYGLVTYTSSGSRTSRTVIINVRYRAVGATDWINLEPFTVTDTYVGNLRKSKRWSVATGQYEVSMQRATADTDSDLIKDVVAWTYLRTFRSDAPVDFPYPLAMTAVRIKATDQLSGVIEDLNATVTSYAPVWDGEAWTTEEEETQNPAALMRLVLTGPANARARSTEQIDDENLGTFYEFCETNGYKFNMVRDYSASVWDVCVDICSSARAAPTIIDGKWGVIMDTADKAVVQHFTPRNSWDFQGEITYTDFPHAWRVKFVNEDEDFEDDERIVYDDGYDKSNATKFESLEFPGITNTNLIWKFGRYHIAQVRLRPQTYTFSADFEHLVCQRGDLIRFSHDVLMVGLGSARIKERAIDESEKVTGVTVDNTFIMESGKSYACRFRLSDSSSLVASVKTVVGEVTELTFKTSIALSSAPAIGDLAMFGISESETAEMLVKSITPSSDLTAKIECVDYAPDIYNADTGDIPDFETNVTIEADITKISPVAPYIIGIESGTAALLKINSGFQSRILVSLQTASSSVRIGQYVVRYALSGSTDWRYVTQTSDQGVVPLNDVEDGETYTIQARAISIYGAYSDWSESTEETVVGQSERPASVTNYSIRVINGIAYHSWDANSEIDIDHYQIKWTSIKSGATWGGAVIIAEKVSSTTITSQSLDGTYLIKAIDVAGNESLTASTFVNSAAEIEGLNYVASIKAESPTFSGTGDGVSYSSSYGGLVLDDGVSEGTFTFSDTVDLGGTFTVLATGAIEVISVSVGNDLYSYSDLYAITDLYGAVEGATNVGIEIATTEREASTATDWSDFTSLVISEYSSRSFHVRLRLKRTDLSVTPVVSAAGVTLDMYDRRVEFEQEIPSGGARVSVSPEFYAIPKPAFSIKNGAEGDRYIISEEAEDGFYIAFTNSGSAVGPRTIYGTLNGYGKKIS